MGFERRAAIVITEPGDTVLVQAHGDIKKDFKGKVTRVDTDNYLIFVRHPKSRITWGACAACVTLREKAKRKRPPHKKK